MTVPPVPLIAALLVSSRFEVVPPTPTVRVPAVLVIVPGVRVVPFACGWMFIALPDALTNPVKVPAPVVPMICTVWPGLLKLSSPRVPDVLAADIEPVSDIFRLAEAELLMVIVPPAAPCPAASAVILPVIPLLVTVPPTTKAFEASL